VNQRQTQSDCDGRESFRRPAICGAHNHNQEERRQDNFRDEACQQGKFAP
jgi:hypothetical protein